MSRFEAILLHAGLWVTALSGAAYFWMRDVLRGADPDSAFHHPWQPHMLALHVVAAPVLVFALGLVTRGHVIEKYREGKPHARLTGTTAILPALPMIATGYLTQIVTGDVARRALGIAHLVCGALFAGLFAAHVAVSRWKRRGNGTAARSRRRAVRGRRLDRP